MRTKFIFTGKKTSLCIYFQEREGTVLKRIHEKKFRRGSMPDPLGGCPARNRYSQQQEWPKDDCMFHQHFLCCANPHNCTLVSIRGRVVIFSDNQKRTSIHPTFRGSFLLSLLDSLYLTDEQRSKRPCFTSKGLWRRCWRCSGCSSWTRCFSGRPSEPSFRCAGRTVRDKEGGHEKEEVERRSFVAAAKKLSKGHVSYFYEIKTR